MIGKINNTEKECGFIIVLPEKQPKQQVVRFVAIFVIYEMIKMKDRYFALIIFLIVIAMVLPMGAIVIMIKSDDQSVIEITPITDIKISTGFLGSTVWNARFGESQYNNDTYFKIYPKYANGTFLKVHWKKDSPGEEWYVKDAGLP